jgi:1-acyl-sn-glycerol-3-phosphate acyltransferase
VFCSLLFIYGRIELALFSFFPMAVSWVWIIYVSNWLGIQFNFVNIILATIIFGLGDDFSIFITDGLLEKYRVNSQSIKSYKSAILLSAITTIIGTGVLIFAEHPAINSIAVLSVSGIASILLITLVVQPLIFKIFITNRVVKRYSPATFFGTLFTTFLYLYYILGCTILNLLIPFFYFFPANKKKKHYLYNYIISKMCKSVLDLGFNIRKGYVGRDKLNFDKPAILLANHVSFLDILLTLKMHPKIIILVNEWVYKSPLFGFPVRYAGFVYIGDDQNKNLKVIKQRISDGYSIMIFPEGTRNPSGKIKRFKKGAFYLAQELGIPIQPILFTGTEMLNPKGDLVIKGGKSVTNVLDRIEPSDPIFKETPRIMSKRINALMRKEIEACRRQDYDTKLLGKRILYNYIYKGPILEWYFKIKWNMERDNFEYYDKIIQGNKKIYDLGCGYGYLGFYLHYRNENHTIIGYDYDKEKIELAQNCTDKNENLNFYYENIKKAEIVNADVVIITDVLHYIKKQEREELFKKIHENLNNSGMVIIRDGVTDLEIKHDKTKRSERYSTKYVKFNKVDSELEFISVQEIKAYAEQYNFIFELKGESKRMSNVIMVLRKR